MLIRPEQPSDVAAIRELTAAAFADVPQSRQTEGVVLDALRGRGGADRLPGRRLTTSASLVLPGVPPENVLAIAPDGTVPSGSVAFHSAFVAE